MAVSSGQNIQFLTAISQFVANEDGTSSSATIMDPTGVPINKDIIVTNRYGPSVPFTGILNNLQTSSNGTCFLNTNLGSKISITPDNQVRYEPNDPKTITCSPTVDNGQFRYSDGQTNVKLDIPTTLRIRIILEELSLLNRESNKFFDERGKQAINLLSNESNDPAGPSSYRMTYMTRRETASTSNYGAWIVVAVIIIIWGFTASYVYFGSSGGGVEQMPSYLLLTIVPAGIIVLMMLGYGFIEGYSMFISPGG